MKWSIIIVLVLALFVGAAGYYSAGALTPKDGQSFPPEKGWQTIDAEVTAYCICEKCCGKKPGHPAYGSTAGGYQIHLGDKSKLVASGPEIPFGSLVKIPGYDNGEPVQVLDRGGAIGRNQFDVLFNESKEPETNHWQARVWGRQHLKVQVQQ